MPLTERPDPEARERRWAAALFFVTCFSVWGSYLWRWQRDGAGDAGARSIQFTLSLMAILLAHEFGHLRMARRHRLHLSLPWFLPSPFMFGTFGAIIRSGDTPRHRTALLEMAAGGPLAGLAVVVALATWSILDSPVTPMTEGDIQPPLLWWLLSFGLRGEPPSMISTQDPFGFAASIGAWVTAMNLIPIGQLDGGHVAAALWPKAARWVTFGSSLVLALLGFLWSGWWVWALVANVVAAGSGTTRESGEPTPETRWWAIGVWVAFALCFSPVPMPAFR